MTYARNNATPLPVLVGSIVNRTTGAVETTGITAEVRKDGGSWVAAANSPTIKEGEWSYTPSQSETDCDTLSIILYKSGCYSRSIQIVFSASSSFGHVGTDQSKIVNPSATQNLAGTSIKTATDVETKVDTKPTLVQIEGSTVLAKESTVGTRATQASVDTKPTLAQIEGSTILAKEATSQSIVTAIQNLNNLSAKINVFGSPLMEIPSTGSTVYAFTVLVKDDEDKLVNLDASPTITAANASGTSRSVNLSAVSNPSTGRYTFTYTVNDTHLPESLRIAVSGAVSAEARYVEWIGAVVDYDSITILQAIKLKTDNLPVNPAAVSDIPTASQNRDTLLNSMPNAGYVNGSLGDRILISTNDQREVAVTGSGHVAAVLHDAEPNSIPEDAFQTDALSNRVLSSSAVTKIVNAIALLQQLVDIATMIDNDGTSLARWSAYSLGLAPTGGGGGGTGAGARIVTITVNLSGSPVEGAIVRLTKGAETYASSTNVSGQITFNVDDGTWAVSITSPNTSFPGASLIISSNISQTYSLTATIPSVPTEPGLCVITFTIVNSENNPVQGATVSMRTNEQNCEVPSKLVSQQLSSATTDSFGQCVLRVIQSSQFTSGEGIYRLTVSEPGNYNKGYSRLVKVPSSLSITADNLTQVGY